MPVRPSSVVNAGRVYSFSICRVQVPLLTVISNSSASVEQKDEHPLLVQPSAGDGIFHILDILVEITRQVGRPWQVHEECPLVVGRRNFFFPATRQAGEYDDKQYGKQVD